MSSVNKVILVGNLGADPEVRYAPTGDAICNLRIATTENWKDKGSGDQREATEWHRVVLYRRLAEIAGQYLKKGSAVFIEGRIRTRKWQDKDGQDRYTTEIEATEMQMLGNRSVESSAQYSSTNINGTLKKSHEVASKNGVSGAAVDYGDDKIPF